MSTAARLVSAFARANKVLKMRKLQPDMEGSKPLCMYQYSIFFGSSRYPRVGSDVFASNRYANHIVVMKNGKMFQLQIENENFEVHSRQILSKGLEEIVRLAEDPESKNVHQIGYFTCSNRDEWAHNYGKLQQISEENRKNLDIIGGALLVLNLDDNAFGSSEQSSSYMLHNRGENRWFDKLQIVVSTDSVAGINMEHTPIDGHTLVRIASDMFNELNGNSPFSPFLKENHEYENVKPIVPVELSFELDVELQAALLKAKGEFESFADQTESIGIIEDMGKRIVKKFGCSPDAFVQMAIQLAYYKTFNRFDSTYESALTKQFLHGRTETIRTVSEHSCNYATAFTEDDLSLSGRLLLEACEHHTIRSRDAKNGKGVDRHLFGLKNLAYQEKEKHDEFRIPKIFTSPYYARYSSNIISTSNCGSDCIDLFGFGPVHPDGIGIGYLMQDSTTHLNVTSFTGTAAPFVKTFKEVYAAQARALRAVNDTKKN